MTNDLLPCREAFEKWLTADGNYPHLKHKNFGGGYLNDEAAMKWDGWKTAWNTRANKPAEVDLDAAIQLVRSGFIVRENIGDLQFDKYAKALELIISLATGKGGGEPAAPAQIDAGELPCGGDPHRNGCEQCEPEHGCRPSRLERAILHCAQKKNAARKSALGSGMLPEKCRVDVDCLAVVIEAARAHLAKSKGGV